MSFLLLKKNTVKEFLLTGNEKMVLCQKNIILHLQELCYSLLTRADVNCENDPQLEDTDRLKILNKIVDVSEMIFEDEDYNFHYRLTVVVVVVTDDSFDVSALSDVFAFRDTNIPTKNNITTSSIVSRVPIFSFSFLNS